MKIKKIYKSLIVRTLDSVIKIDTLIEGLLISTYGILISVFGIFLFKYLKILTSHSISKVGFFAYLSIFLYHFVGYQHDKEKKDREFIKKIDNIILMCFGIFLSLIVYLFLFDAIIYMVKIFISVRPEFGYLKFVLSTIPGCILLMIPLLFWEFLSEISPIDEIIERLFK